MTNEYPIWIYSNIRIFVPHWCKQKTKCKLFPKGGDGSTPKFTIKKSLYTVKRGFKRDFFNTRMCFGKLWEQQKKFWVTNFFCWNFCQKVYISRGWGGQRQFVKSSHLDIFFHPSLICLQSSVKCDSPFNKRHPQKVPGKFIFASLLV